MKKYIFLIINYIKNNLKIAAIWTFAFGIILSYITDIAKDYIKEYTENKDIYIQGVWVGWYNEQGKDIPSAMRIANKNDNKFSGVIIEEKIENGKGRTTSNVTGTSKGLKIEFKKEFASINNNNDKISIFHGTLDENGKVIEGVWSDNYNSGKFKFVKD